MNIWISIIPIVHDGYLNLLPRFNVYVKSQWWLFNEWIFWANWIEWYKILPSLSTQKQCNDYHDSHVSFALYISMFLSSHFSSVVVSTFSVSQQTHLPRDFQWGWLDVGSNGRMNGFWGLKFSSICHSLRFVSVEVKSYLCTMYILSTSYYVALFFASIGLNWCCEYGC